MRQRTIRASTEPGSTNTQTLCRNDRTALQIKRLRSHNIPSDLRQGLLKLLFQILTAHNLRGLRHLSQQLLQPPEQADQAAFVDVGHFATRLSQHV